MRNECVFWVGWRVGVSHQTYLFGAHRFHSEAVHLDDPESLLIIFFRIGLLGVRAIARFLCIQQPGQQPSQIPSDQLDSQTRSKHWVDFQEFIPASMNQKFKVESFKVWSVGSPHCSPLLSVRSHVASYLGRFFLMSATSQVRSCLWLLLDSSGRASLIDAARAWNWFLRPRSFAQFVVVILNLSKTVLSDFIAKLFWATSCSFACYS